MTPRVSLFRELERVLASGDRAMICAISHGQVTVDGYTVKVTDDRRWTRAQLAGRMAKCHSRAGRLFGTTEVCRTPPPSMPHEGTQVA